MPPLPPVVLQLQWATHKAMSALEREAESLGLRAADMNVLFNLWVRGPTTAGALAGASRRKPSTLTGVIDRLERTGLLEREWGNGADRRAVSLSLTPDGKEAAARAFRVMDHYGKQLMAVVAPEDREGFRRGLSAIATKATTKAPGT